MKTGGVHKVFLKDKLRRGHDSIMGILTSVRSIISYEVLLLLLVVCVF